MSKYGLGSYYIRKLKTTYSICREYYINGKRKYESIPRLKYEQMGFDLNWTYEEAKIKCSIYNKEKWLNYTKETKRYSKPRSEYDEQVKYTKKSWSNMRYRCGKNNKYKNITYCDRWKDFKNFLSDMGIRPKGYSLDRINTLGNYEPGNCRWANLSVQAFNRKGTSKNLSDIRLIGVTVRYSTKGKPRYKVCIRFNNITYCLGTYPSLDWAHEVYCNKYKELHGKDFNQEKI